MLERTPCRVRPSCHCRLSRSSGSARDERATQSWAGSNLSYCALLLSVNDTGSFTWFFMMERSSRSKQLARLKGHSEPSCCSGRWVTMG